MIILICPFCGSDEIGVEGNKCELTKFVCHTCEKCWELDIMKDEYEVEERY